MPRFRSRPPVATAVAPAGGADLLWGDSLAVDDTFAPRFVYADTLTVADRLESVATAIGDSLGVSDTIAALILTAVAADSLAVTDQAAPRLVVADTFAISEGPFAATVGVPETAGLADLLSSVGMLGLVDSAGISDFMTVDVVDVYVDPSGTPDSDIAGDGWTDEDNTGTNHGTDVLLEVRPSVIAVQGEKRAWMKLDMSIFSGLVAATGGTHILEIRGQNGNLTSGTDTVSFGTPAADPFTESTLDWDNQPAVPSEHSVNITTGGSSNVNHDVSLTDALVNNAIGDWLLVAIVENRGVTQTTGDIDYRARDNTASVERPHWTFQLEIA